VVILKNQVSTKPIGLNKPAIASFIFFLQFYIVTPSVAQISEKYFYDQEQKDRGYVNVSSRCGVDIVFGGTSFVKNGLQTTITKIDNLGNVIWLSELPSVSLVQKLITGSDGVIYAVCRVSSSTNHILKIDPLNGSILWSKSITVASNVLTFLDFDNNSLLIGFASSYNGSDFTHQIGLIDKASGLLTTRTIGKVNWQYSGFSVGFDTDKNIYYTLKDTVYKASGNAPFILKWKRHHAGSGILNIQRIHIDRNNNMFLLGSKEGTFNRGIAVRISVLTGDLLSNVVVDTRDAAFSALTENATHLFVNWRPLGIGGYTGWWTTKIDKATGAIAWNSSYNLNGSQVNTTLFTDTEIANDLLLDSNGDVIVTGSFDGSGNSDSPGKWGILKLSGQTGVRVYEKLILGSLPNAVHTRSEGLSVFLVNHKLAVLGNIQTYKDIQPYDNNDRSTPAYITLDPASGEILTQSYFYGDYEFPSQVYAIERDGDDMVILKQVGRNLVLGKYDQHQNVVWEKTIKKEYLLMNGKMHLTPSGKIGIAALRKRLSPYSPYYDPDTRLGSVFYFEKDGTLRWQNEFFTPGEILDVHADENDIFVLTRILEQSIQLNKFSANASSQALVDVSPYSSSNSINIFDDTGTVIRVAGYQTALGSRVLSFNKSDLSTTITSLPYQLTFVGSITKLNENEFIISEKVGSRQNYIMRYNLTLSQIVWSRVLGDAKSSTYKIIKDSNEKYIVTLGVDDGYTSLRKIDLTNGSILGTFVNTIAGINSIPTDAAINETNAEIIFTGYYNSSSGTSDKNIIIGSVNLTDLKLRQTTLIQGNFSGDNIGTSVEVASDGTTWIGGNRNIEGLHKAAFVYSKINQGPITIDLSPKTSNENVAANSIVGSLSTTDLDAGDIFAYTLVAGTGSTDNAFFNISGSSLRIAASPDFETKSSYNIRVRSTDQGNLFFEKQFTITINDLNEASTDIVLSALATDENVAANSVVGSFTSVDADVNNTFAYTLVAGTGSTDNTSFNISGNDIRILASPDFETKSSYSIRVRSTDQGNLFFEKQFTLAVNDLDETITSIDDVSTQTFNFRIYPNPAENILKIEFFGEASINTKINYFTIFNYLGIAVINGLVDGKNSEVDISGLPSGLYLLKVATDDKKNERVIRFIVKR
jgi:Secretion system C-terminal sorting domain